VSDLDRVVAGGATGIIAAAASHDWRMLIDGELVAAEGGRKLDAINPATGQVITQIPVATTGDMDRAVAAAVRAFPAWRRRPVAERAELVRKLADAIEHHGEQLALIDTIDNGTPLRVLRADAGLAAEQLRYFAGLALELKGDTIPGPEAGSLDFTIREPFGVVGRIVPFNHPLMFAASKLAAPLVAGNTIVLKPSEQTSLSALRLGELCGEIFPPGTVNVLSGLGSEIGDHLVAHPDVPRLALTGSVAVGRRVLRRAAEVAVKVVTLELGGKNPMIVFGDAPYEQAVDGALAGMNFTWQGQSCGSTSRLYVHRSRYEQFTTDLAARMDQLVVGDPLSSSTDVGAIVSRTQFESVVDYIKAGVKDPKMRLLAGGLPDQGTGDGGWYIRPTLFAADTDHDSPVVREEIFGPVLVAMPFDGYDEVIGFANSLPLGLTASVWTDRLATAMRACRDLEAGYVWVNASSWHIPGTPFGGVKNSGAGREEGIEELMSYTQSKNVYIRFDQAGGEA
jgi:acyl-CoA reductase-like NAD-dependent aldehyde dehydrogenase